MRLIIAGGRDMDLSCTPLYQFINHFLNYKTPDEVVSGGARGIDVYGEEYAANRGIKVKRFLPDYKTHPSKVAPIMRNKEMAKYGDALLLIWSGDSPGSRNMKEEMLKLNKKVFEVVLKVHNES